MKLQERLGFYHEALLLKIGLKSLRRQDLLCLFLYYLGFSRIRSLVFRFCRMPVARILAFHDVSNDHMENFRAKIKVLREQANVISLDDICSGKMSWQKLNVAITFDDGYRGWVDNVSFVLREFGLTATFFVSSGFVGLREDKEADFVQSNLRSSQRTTGGLKVEELKKLAEEGFTVGGHTCNHVNLPEMDDRNRLSVEIQKDKEELERITERKIEYFAYPFGFHWNERFDLVRILKESGYRGAVTIIPGYNTADTNKFLLRRDLVDASLPLSVFKARLQGNHDAVELVRRILRRFKHQH